MEIDSFYDVIFLTMEPYWIALTDVGPILPLEGIKLDDTVKSLYYDTDFAAEWTFIIGVYTQ